MNYRLEWAAKLHSVVVNADDEIVSSEQIGEYSNYVTFDSVKLIKNVSELVGQQLFNKLLADSNI
jgi:hypothetical protein